MYEWRQLDSFSDTTSTFRNDWLGQASFVVMNLLPILKVASLIRVLLSSASPVWLAERERTSSTTR